MALPTNVNYGTVVGQFLLAYADSSDAEPYPDGIPAKGSIFFRPSPVKLLDSVSTPNPVTILPAVVECVLDAEGYLLGYPGDRGVRLVATDDPDLNPTGWTWTVEFRLTDQDDIPVPIPSFSIALPSDTTVDLTTVSPVPSANGTYYLVGPTGPANTLTVGTVTTLAPEEDATVSITGTAPSQTISFGIPQGLAASVAVGSTATVLPGAGASVTNSGTSADAVLEFEIPQGIAATVDVGTTTTVEYGTPAAVVNSGTTGAAVFDFTLPSGPVGPIGPIGPTGATGIEWQGTWDSLTDYVNNDAVFYNGASWFAAGDPPVGDIPSESSLYWFPLALQGATGPQGPQGEQGIQGIQGIQGETGLQGEQGFGYQGITSATSSSIGTGSKTFTVNKVDALAVGNRVRVADAAVPTNFVEGIITGIAGLNVTINADHTGGSGIIASWNIGITGARGDQGPAGSIESLTANAPVTYAAGAIGFDWSSTTVADLGDVTIGTKADGDLIKWNSTSSQWENSNVIDGGGA